MICTGIISNSFLHFKLVPIVSFHVPLIFHKPFVNEMSLLRYEFFVRTRLLNNKKSLLMYKFIKRKIISSLEIALPNIPGMYMYF